MPAMTDVRCIFIGQLVSAAYANKTQHRHISEIRQARKGAQQSFTCSLQARVEKRSPLSLVSHPYTQVMSYMNSPTRRIPATFTDPSDTRSIA